MKRGILFVDDDPNVLEGLRRAFRPFHHEWHMAFARDGHEALQLLAQTPFEVVVTDILMPEMDGLEVVRTLHKSFPAVKIVVISGGYPWDSRTYLNIAHKLGAHRLLPKPFSPHALIEAVREALQH